MQTTKHKPASLSVVRSGKVEKVQHQTNLASFINSDLVGRKQAPDRQQSPTKKASHNTPPGNSLPAKKVQAHLPPTCLPECTPCWWLRRPPRASTPNSCPRSSITCLLAALRRGSPLPLPLHHQACLSVSCQHVPPRAQVLWLAPCMTCPP